jgi:hypothetical protein
MLHELYKEGGGTGKRGATTSKDSGVGAQQNDDHKSGTMFQTMENEFVLGQGGFFAMCCGTLQ